MESQEKQEKTVSPTLTNMTDSNRIGRLLVADLDNSTNVEILNSIYKLLIVQDEQDNLDSQIYRKELRRERNDEEKRNNELIKALTGKKPSKKKPSRVQEPITPGKGQQPETGKAPAPAPAPSKAPAPAPAPKTPTKVPEPTTPAPTAKPAPSKPTQPTATKAPIPTTGNKGLVVSALAAAGILTPSAVSNVLAQVEAESNFKPQSENLNYSSAQAIQNTFGVNRIPSLEFAQTLVKNAEALANHVYAKSDGNSQEGDGWKYRGRGFIQITGKNAYKSLSDFLKIDLISNPDLLNTPDIAAKSIPWFFLKYKSYLTKGDPAKLEDISVVNKAVGFANKKLKSGEMESEHRLKLAEKHKNEIGVPSNQSLPETLTPTTGAKVDTVSKENKELKKSLTNEDKTVVVPQNNSTPLPSSSSGSQSQSRPDDASPYSKKARK